VTANEVTAASLVLGGLAGVLVANGFFALAATTFALASLGDALDGAVARSSGNESPGGALFDACADRYEEFFFLTGLAFRLHSHRAVLALILFALLGSFMVSYGSAKAEALGVPVPTSTMRRPQRAACLSLGTVLVPIFTLVARRCSLPEWMSHASVLVALGLLAVLGNVSAIVRLRGIALATSSKRSHAEIPLHSSRRIERNHTRSPEPHEGGAAPESVRRDQRRRTKESTKESSPVAIDGR
jgi:phosphatidylglycerophosphate synthase